MLLNEHLFKLKEIMHQFGIYNKDNAQKCRRHIMPPIGVGFPWRDIPEEFDFWNTIFQKFNLWFLKEKLMLIFKKLVKNTDLELSFSGGSFIKAHEHSTRAISEKNQTIGKYFFFLKFLSYFFLKYEDKF